MNNIVAKRIWTLIIVGLVLIILKSAGILLLPWGLVSVPFLFLLIFFFLIWYRLYRTLLKDRNSAEPKLDMAKHCIKAQENSKSLSPAMSWLYLWRFIKDIKKRKITKL